MRLITACREEEKSSILLECPEKKLAADMSGNAKGRVKKFYFVLIVINSTNHEQCLCGDLGNSRRHLFHTRIVSTTSVVRAELLGLSRRSEAEDFDREILQFHRC